MDRLAELRERRALTLRELAEMSGVAADTINQIELGHRRARPSTLRKLSRALGVDVREFFEEPALPKDEAPSAGQAEDLPDLRKPIDLRHYKGDLFRLKDALEAERQDLRSEFTSREAFFNPTPEEAQRHLDYLTVLDNSLAVRDALDRDRGRVR